MERGARHALNVATVVRKGAFEDQGVRLLRQFLFQTNLNLQAKDSFNHVNDVRDRMAEMYRKHIAALEGRASVLSHVFETEIGYLVKHYSKKKKGAPVKKNLRIVARLSAIKPEVKQRVLSLYMARMKFYYTVKTLKWFLLYRSD